jgi:hypothetical protein
MVRDRGKGVEREIALRRRSSARVKLSQSGLFSTDTSAGRAARAAGCACGRGHQDQSATTRCARPASPPTSKGGEDCDLRFHLPCQVRAWLRMLSLPHNATLRRAGRHRARALREVRMIQAEGIFRHHFLGQCEGVPGRITDQGRQHLDRLVAKKVLYHPGHVPGWWSCFFGLLYSRKSNPEIRPPPARRPSPADGQ